MNIKELMHELKRIVVVFPCESFPEATHMYNGNSSTGQLNFGLVKHFIFFNFPLRFHFICKNWIDFWKCWLSFYHAAL